MPATAYTRNVTLTDPHLTKSNSDQLIERLLGHFLFHRGQIDKPLEQLRDENKPAMRVKLQYSERSTPYKHKGCEGMFATPLPATPSVVRDVEGLARSLHGFSIHTEGEENRVVGRLWAIV